MEKKIGGLDGGKNGKVFLPPPSFVPIVCILFFLIFSLSGSASAVSSYSEVDLVSDLPGVARTQDLNLVNPWGITSSPTSPFWISDNGMGVSTLYNGNGIPFPVGSPLVVTIPPPSGGTPPAAPTGVIFNGASPDFQGSIFIFATEDGTVAGWNGGTTATLKADNSPSGAVYKGIAIANTGSANLLYAANFNAGRIDVFDKNFNPTTVPGFFADPNIPAGFAPFNITNIGGLLYVTYAKQDSTKHDDVAGPGNGFVDVFDANGNLVKRLVIGGPLNSPWGTTIAPANFGDFKNDLLIGNFGDGTINAFDLTSGNFLGSLSDGTGNPVVIEGLWGLRVGNGGNGGDTDKVYFTAGIPGPGGNIEDHGLFGSVQVPEPATLLLLGSGIVGVVGIRRKIKK